MKVKNKKALKITLISLGAVLCLALIYAITLFIMYKSVGDTGLPRLDIDTNGRGILSNTKYTTCTISLSGADEEFNFEDASAGIRQRGNTSRRFYPKEPYRIKFDSKTSVFGEAKNKSWVLLALYNDFSLSRDRLAFSVAERVMEGDFVPCHYYVDVYINGFYKGVYLLTDQVNENKGRLDIKEDITADDVEIPFLVELDDYASEEGEEGVDWFTLNGRYFAIKYPEAEERPSEAQFAYIKNYIETVDSLVRKPNVTLSELSEYIDVESFINYYIVQEAMGQMEINWKSIYMSKSLGGKLKMGPVWDFDWSTTGPSLGKMKDFYKDNATGLRSADNWFALLLNNSSEFKAAVCARFDEVKPDILDAISEVESQKDSLYAAARKNHRRWYWFSFKVYYDESFDETIQWCKDRLEWLDTIF